MTDEISTKIEDQNQIDNLSDTDLDPDILEIKKKLEEEKAIAHTREKTIDMQARLNKEIEDALTQNSQELLGKSGATKESDFIGHEENNNKENPIQNPIENPLENEWNKCIEEAKNPIEIVEDIPLDTKNSFAPENKDDISAEVESPFNRKGIEKIAGHPKINRPIVPRAPVSNKLLVKLIKTPIYDLLLEKTNMHANMINEYELRKLLTKHENIFNDKYFLLKI